MSVFKHKYSVIMLNVYCDAPGCHENDSVMASTAPLAYASHVRNGWCIKNDKVLCPKCAHKEAAV